MFKTYVPKPGPYLLAMWIFLFPPPLPMLFIAAAGWATGRTTPLAVRAAFAKTIGERETLYRTGIVESDRLDRVVLNVGEHALRLLLGISWVFAIGSLAVSV